MGYRIEFTPSAERAFRSLPVHVQKSARRKLSTLEADPRPEFAAPLRYGLKGLWKFRVGDFRFAYTVQDEILIVLVIVVGNRKDIYPMLDRMKKP